MTRRTILAYHGVARCGPDDDPHRLFVSPEAFAAQMAALARRRRVVSLDEVLDDGVSDGRPLVAITFDDAYESVLTEAAPVLRAHGFPATVFAPTAWLGRRSAWMQEMRAPVDILDPDGLRALEREGVQVESHGHGHIDLSAADEGDIRRDLEQSISALTEILGRAPRFLAYPFRTGSPVAADVAAELGFADAFSIDLPDEGRFRRGRVQVTPLDGPALFRLKTGGLYLRLRFAPPLAAAYRVSKIVLRR